eukprot:m.110257 g.110257  ORF g.110257 m.110257 type:complete len:52 (-) comp9333_c0_seq4:1294-1449(-)
MPSELLFCRNIQLPQQLLGELLQAQSPSPPQACGFQLAVQFHKQNSDDPRT